MINERCCRSSRWFQFSCRRDSRGVEESWELGVGSWELGVAENKYHAGEEPVSGVSSIGYCKGVQWDRTIGSVSLELIEPRVCNPNSLTWAFQTQSSPATNQPFGLQKDQRGRHQNLVSGSCPGFACGPPSGLPSRHCASWPPPSKSSASGPDLVIGGIFEEAAPE